jgi:hypothetical protein
VHLPYRRCSRCVGASVTYQHAGVACVQKAPAARCARGPAVELRSTGAATAGVVNALGTRLDLAFGLGPSWSLVAKTLSEPVWTMRSAFTLEGRLPAEDQPTLEAKYGPDRGGKERARNAQLRFSRRL